MIACFGQLLLLATLASFVWLSVHSVSSFSTLLHLTVQDIAVDWPLGTFSKGAEIHIGLGVYHRSAVQAMMAYLVQWGNAGGPLFLLQDGCQYLVETDIVCGWRPRELFKP